MRYGRSVPEGFLPVMSVNTEEEAEKLLIAACARNEHGEFVARELAHEQTIENLFAFGDKLEKYYEAMMARRQKAKA